MAKSANRPNLVVLLILVALAGIGAYVWWHKRQTTAEPVVATATATKNPPPVSATPVPADKIDPANEGRVVSIDGTLSVQKPPRDTQLGITADAVMLLRFAEMLQWQETCANGSCTYQQVWSPQVIGSRKFREPQGHTNPERLPMTSGRFSAGEMRLGAFVVDAAMLGNYRLDSALQTKPVPYPVSSAQLPSNVAISFRDSNGALYAGDPEHRAVGDLRVSYRIIPAGKVELIGTQRGDRLIVQRSKSNPPS